MIERFRNSGGDTDGFEMADGGSVRSAIGLLRLGDVEKGSLVSLV